MPKLSIVILNYNTCELTLNCLKSLDKVRSELDFEIIVVDNASNDVSVESLKKIPKIKLVENKTNLGFAKGNNTARNIVLGEYILFLNSDTEIYEGALSKTSKYLDEHASVGAITCKLVLPTGKLDKDSRRSFPTPWVAFSHFSGLDRLFPKSPMFSRYWYGYVNEDDIQSVDVIQGAFFLTRRDVLDKVNWFDEDYFLDGEDIDLCFKIKNEGYSIIYFPKVSTMHIKKASKKGKRSYASIMAGVNSMQIFYQKHLNQSYPTIVTIAVNFGIMVLKVFRTINYFITL